LRRTPVRCGVARIKPWCSANPAEGGYISVEDYVVHEWLREVGVALGVHVRHEGVEFLIGLEGAVALEIFDGLDGLETPTADLLVQGLPAPTQVRPAEVLGSTRHQAHHPSLTSLS
jgi:hypothetical protein